LQLYVHEPAVQLVVEFVRGAHAAPHAPQFVVLVLRSISQPFDAAPSQLARPDEHVPRTHAPAEQLADANGNEQTRPQTPQFAVDVASVVSQPLSALPSQFPNPAAHAPRTQAPPVHDPEALAYVHTVVHEPQCAGSVPKFASQPFANEPSQLPKPLGHVAGTHVPPAHASPAEQLRLHRPQYVLLLFRSASQPSALL
jgi:hypothetical protein